MRLEPARKAAGSFDRTVSVEETFRLVPILRERFGITRVGETTYLDRTGVPTMCAIVPDSPDLLSVYNGKGRTRTIAAVSAVMEAVERQAAARPTLPTFEMPAEALLAGVDYRECGFVEPADGAAVTCVEGVDLSTEERVAVPLAAVQCPWYGEPSFKTVSTNGLASGNTYVEAVYHALAEVIERHVWSLFYVRSQLVPRFYLGAAAADRALGDEVSFPTGDAQVDELAAAVSAAGLALRVLCLREPPLPPLMLASVVEPDADPPMAHTGLGCSPSPRHALERAITECVQSRAVDIQAAREDILRPGETAGAMGAHARRRTSLPYGRWYFDLPAPRIALGDLADRMHPTDLRADVDALAKALRSYGCERIVVVDLSPRDAPVHVVRVIVPRLETTTIDGRIGRFGMREFNPFYVRAAG